MDTAVRQWLFRLRAYGKAEGEHFDCHYATYDGPQGLFHNAA